MTRLALCVATLALLLGQASAAVIPSADQQVAVTLPDFGAELRSFEAPADRPISWWPHVVNAGWGGGRGGPERRGGWLDEHWKLIDCLDRSADYTTHDYLNHRGIWYEVYGSNEYQETIHFHEDGARKLLWDNGIARDMNGERVLSAHYNTSHQWWADKVGWDAFIVCNNAPRWWSVINYDWLTSPLLGFSISQDNIGGPTSRIGAGGHGRYCDHCNRKFRHYLQTTKRLPEFLNGHTHIRDYVKENLTDVTDQLPPAVKHRFDEEEAALLHQMCAPPVMSEYLKFLYISHMHNFLRQYKDARLIAERMGREYDVHGNQGGGFVGPNPYQIALSDFVDTVWFETNGMSAYDMFKYHWNNAWGAFRYEMGWAMTQGVRPFMSMTGFKQRTPDIVEHELAEACAGGGVLFVNQAGFEDEPELSDLLTRYFQFRCDHRALFAGPGKQRYAQVGLMYSIPTMMYYAYQHATGAQPVNAMSGMARALEEGHIPFDVVILRHPEIHADTVTVEELLRYKLLILPALECLSDAQIALISQYVEAGGTLGLLGNCGIRDEDNLPRDVSPVEQWRRTGRVVELLPGRRFLANRVVESDATQELTRVAIESTRSALGGETLVSGDLDRLLWVKTWRHPGDFLSLHFVNYNVDFESGEATSTQPVPISLKMPADIPAEEAIWLAADGKRQALDFSLADQSVSVTVPATHVYGVLAIGRKGLDAVRSAVLQGDAMLARARMASGGSWGDLAEAAEGVEEMAKRCAGAPGDVAQATEYAKSAGDLLGAVQEAEDAAYQERVRQAADVDGAALALDFGVEEAAAPWQAVGPDTQYRSGTGFGWLPTTDTSEPTPEELYYAMAQKYGERFTTARTAGRLLFWPYRDSPPVPLRTHLSSGQGHRFRIDVPAGQYTVRVVTTNPAWTNRNFLVSGMVRINGAARCLDAVHDKGDVLAREVAVSAEDGKLEFDFGGPTGWGICALTIFPRAGDDAPAGPTQPIRAWRVSARYANPDWYPITQVSAPPERNPGTVATDGWTTVTAADTGEPVIDLGTNQEAEVGDVVYAVTYITAGAPGRERLHFGASSQAQIWLNGEPVAYVPNEKGVRRDELVAEVDLRAGRNVLMIKLQRFWERRWQFYATITG